MFKSIDRYHIVGIDKKYIYLRQSVNGLGANQDSIAGRKKILILRTDQEIKKYCRRFSCQAFAGVGYSDAYRICVTCKYRNIDK